MALSLLEKLDIQERINDNLARLEAGISDLMERLDVQEKVNADLDLLFGSQTAKSLYQRLLDGEFNHLGWQDFYQKLKEACEEYGGGAVSALDPAEAYLREHYDPATDSFAA